MTDVVSSTFIYLAYESDATEVRMIAVYADGSRKVAATIPRAEHPGSDPLYLFHTTGIDMLSGGTAAQHAAGISETLISIGTTTGARYASAAAIEPAVIKRGAVYVPAVRFPDGKIESLGAIHPKTGAIIDGFRHKFKARRIAKKELRRGVKSSQRFGHPSGWVNYRGD